MEAELQERLESSQKQVTRVVELYEGLKGTVERLKVEPDSGAGKTRAGRGLNQGSRDGPVGSVRLCRLRVCLAQEVERVDLYLEGCY